MTDKRKVMRLGDIIDSFKTSLSKTAANGEPTEDDQAAAQAQAQAQADADAQAQAQAQAAAAPQAPAVDPDGDGDDDSSNEVLTAAAQNVVNADQQLDNAVDALKSIAKQAQDTEASALEKDASEFGKIFADSFLETLNERAEVSAIQKEAYDITMSKIAEVNDVVDEDTYTAIVKEAYDMTIEATKVDLQKVAETEEISEDTLNQIIKEAYDLTMNSVDEFTTLDELSNITKVAYDFTLDTISKES